MPTPPLTEGACAALRDPCNYRICVEPLILRVESVASEPALGDLDLGRCGFTGSEGPQTIAATLSDRTSDTKSVIFPVNHRVHDNRPGAGSGGAGQTPLRAGDVIRVLQMVRIPLFKPRTNE